MNELEVLLLTSRLSPAAGGLAVSVPGLAHSIDRLQGVKMHVFGTTDPSDPLAAQSWGPRVTSFDVIGPNALHVAPRMFKAVRKLSPDLLDIQGLWTYPSLVSLRYTRKFNTPYLITPRGMLDPWARQNSSWKKALAGAAFENAHIAGATALRATAEMEAKHFRDMGLRNPIVVVPNGISMPPLEEKIAKHKKQILFLSRLHPKKGVSFLLHSWASLQDQNPSWELIIAGIDEAGHENELKALAKALELKRIYFVGEFHGQEKQKLYRNADLFVLPTHAENFGLVVAEALAQETPVITTFNAPWKGLQDNACGWWIPLEQKRLTETIQAAILKDPFELAEMGRRGRQWIARDFSIEQVACKMHQTYRWAAQGGPKPEFLHV